MGIQHLNMLESQSNQWALATWLVEQIVLVFLGIQQEDVGKPF